MRKLKLSGILLSLLFIGCNKSNTNNVGSNNQKIEVVKEASNNLDERYIGGWKLVDANVGDKRNDNSMDGIICEMTKYLNSNESYVFHLFTGNELILTRETDNHLVGQNANMNADYNESDKKLTISIPGSSSFIFKKLK